MEHVPFIIRQTHPVNGSGEQTHSTLRFAVHVRIALLQSDKLKYVMEWSYNKEHIALLTGDMYFLSLSYVGP
jgi:hypothetical protein